jgi:endo-1,3-1,4-beta-glycanase ExoK
VIGHPDPTITYPTHAGYTLALAEEFDNPIDFATDANWAWSDGNVPGGSVRFVQDQITFSPGYMMITAINRPAGVVPPALSFAQNATNEAPTAQLSGEMRTTYNNYRYGWYEARYKPPTSTGNFISTFFIFRTPQKQDWREIDIELTPTGTGSPGPGGIGTNFYYYGTPAMPNGGLGYNANGTHNDGNEMVPLPNGITNNQADFHVYAFEWQPTFIKWYVDGTMVRSCVAASATSTKCTAQGENSTSSVPIPDQAAKIFMNLWIFGSPNAFGGDNPDSNTYPLTATYDYVRFYRLSDTTLEPTYPCSPTPTCVAPADILESKNNPTDGVTNYCISGGTSTTICGN